LPAGAHAERERHKRLLAVGAKQRVDLVLAGLHAVIGFFLGALASVFFRFGNAVLMRDFEVLLVGFLHKRRKRLIDIRNRGAAVLMAGNLRDDLRSHGAGHTDRARAFNLGIAQTETVLQHAFQINQAAVGKRQKGRIVHVVEMQIATVVRFQNVLGQEIAGELLGDDAGHQIAHHRKDIGILIGVLGRGFNISLVHKTHQLGVQFGTTGADHVAVVAVLDINARHIRAGFHQRVFDHFLDGRNIERILAAGAALLLDLTGDAECEFPWRWMVGRPSCALASFGNFGSVVFDDCAIALGNLQHCFNSPCIQSETPLCHLLAIHSGCLRPNSGGVLYSIRQWAARVFLRISARKFVLHQ